MANKKAELKDRIATGLRIRERTKQEVLELQEQLQNVVEFTGSDTAARKLAPDLFDRLKAAEKRFKKTEALIDQLESKLAKLK